MTSEALEVIQPPAPSAPMSVDDLVEQSQMVVHAMKRAMQEGTHYGKIPGVSKPSLWKPGAEKLLVMFRLGASYDHAETWHDDDHYTVRATCRLHHIPTGNQVGSADGLCTTREKKYANKKPVAEVYNTVLKMAQKRALVAAVLNATAASDIFTMDVEDFKDAPARRSSNDDLPFVAPEKDATTPSREQIAELRALRGDIVKRFGVEMWNTQFAAALENAGVEAGGEPNRDEASSILVHLRLVVDPGVGEPA